MAEQLPVDIFTLVLRHVPPADRFSSCALVSQKLHRAAAAATDALDLAFTQGQEQRAEAFKGYLQQHGRHLTSLKLQQTVGQAVAQLPCSRLLRLEVGGGTVQLGPHNGLPGMLSSCTALTRLDLSDCFITTSLSGLSALLVNLRDLRLARIWEPSGAAVLPGSVVSCMQHLTRLHLSGVDVEDAHHVSCLSSLSVLSTECWGSVRLAPDTAPGFVLPASLHELSLTGTGVELDPAVLSAAVHLTRLQLGRVTVVGQGDVSGGAALLAAVSGLHKLNTLELESLRSVWPEPSAAYQALTASSRLQRFRVWGCRLPAGAFDYVFQPVAVCGELQWLSASDEMSAVAVSALVQCCPRLQDLSLTVRSGPAVAALKPLTGLTRLDLTACDSNTAYAAECVRGVAALTSLCSLRLPTKDAPAFGRASLLSLLPLTALTQLTSCQLGNDRLANQAGPEQPPDVWQQLRQLCLADTRRQTQ